MEPVGGVRLEPALAGTVSIDRQRRPVSARTNPREAIDKRIDKHSLYLFAVPAASIYSAPRISWEQPQTRCGDLSSPGGATACFQAALSLFLLPFPYSPIPIISDAPKVTCTYPLIQQTDTEPLLCAGDTKTRELYSVPQSVPRYDMPGSYSHTCSGCQGSRRGRERTPSSRGRKLYSEGLLT